MREQSDGISQQADDAETMQLAPARKKARTTQDKESKMRDLQDELEQLRGRTIAGALVQPLADAQQAVANVRPFKDVLNELGSAAVKDLAKVVHGTGNNDHRYSTIGKTVMRAHFELLQLLEKRVKAGHECLKVAAELSVASSYANEGGAVDWSGLHEDLLKRLVALGNPNRMPVDE